MADGAVRGGGKEDGQCLGTTLDYLVDETGNQSEIKDKSMLNRVVEIENLDQEDMKTICVYSTVCCAMQS